MLGGPGPGNLLKLSRGLIGCYYRELELFGYSVLIKDSIASVWMTKLNITTIQKTDDLI